MCESLFALLFVMESKYSSGLCFYRVAVVSLFKFTLSALSSPVSKLCRVLAVASVTVSLMKAVHMESEMGRRIDRRIVHFVVEL